jgi:hypothetical protein
MTKNTDSDQLCVLNNITFSAVMLEFGEKAGTKMELLLYDIGYIKIAWD